MCTWGGYIASLSGMMEFLNFYLIPGVVLVIPNYQIVVKLGLYNSYLGLIIPGAFSGKVPEALPWDT